MTARVRHPLISLLAFGLALAAAAVAGGGDRRDGSPAPAAAAAGFEDVAERAGVAAPHRTRTFDNPYAEIMAGYTALGAAAAVADYDGDGWEDLFVTDSAAGGRNRLWRNLHGETGELRFADVAAEAGVAAGNDDRNASADALWFDYDGDRRPDLFVVRFGGSILYRNLGGGRFADVTARAGLGARANAITAVAFDYDLDGDLDLFTGEYFRRVDLFDPDTPRFFPESMEAADNGGGVTVWRNDGGRFADATAEAGIALSGWTLDLGHADFDGDGDDDLYVACDFGTDRLLVNGGDGTFTDRTREAIGIDTKKGMNADWGDYDGDGLLDLYVTNITDDYMREGNFLWRNHGDGTFADVARETGTHDTGWGWAGKFVDFDNDGRLDLYVVNGWVSAGPESYVPDVFELILREDADLADVREWPPMGAKSLSGYQRSRLFRNRGDGLFEEVAERHGVDSVRDGRGIAVADFDRDGRLDLFVANADAAPHLYRNRLEGAGEWIAFRLEGRESNRDAIGAQLRATAGGRTMLRFVDGGNGFAGQSSRRVHFGLGDAEAVERLEVRWPSGRRQAFGPLAAGRLYRIVEGEPAARPVEPMPPLARARAAVAAGDDAAALEDFEAALAADADDLEIANDYRRAVIRTGEYDRALAFFEKLTADHPGSAHAWLNYGYVYVDKIPTAGSITRVILANQALERFTRSLECERTWIGLYTRGNSYLYWPVLFGRAPLGVADLEEAMAMVRDDPEPKAVHVRTWIALGDGYWRTDRRERARSTWREGLERYPGDPELEKRLALDGEAIDRYLYEQRDPNLRVDTDLAPLWVDTDLAPLWVDTDLAPLWGDTDLAPLWAE